MLTVSRCAAPVRRGRCQGYKGSLPAVTYVGEWGFEDPHW